MTDQTDRRERYATAMDAVTGGICPTDLIDAVMAVADAELQQERERLFVPLHQAEAENARLRRMAGEAQQDEPTDEDVVEAHRLALSLAIGLGTGGPWDVILERAAELHAAETAAHAAPQDPTQDGEAKPAPMDPWHILGIESAPDHCTGQPGFCAEHGVHRPAVARPGQPETEA